MNNNNNNNSTNTKPCSKHPGAGASSYCRECKKYMCAECKKIHDSFFDTEHESAIDSPENTKVPDSTSNNNNNDNKCKIHPEYPLDTICNDCSCLCCLKCKIEGEHKGHNTVPLGESQEVLKVTLERSVASLERCQSTAEETPQRVNEWLDAADIKIREIAELIHKSFDEIKKAVDKREKELLECFERSKAEIETTMNLTYEATKFAEEVPDLVKDVKALLCGWDSKKPPAATAAEKVLSAQKKAVNGERIVKELKLLEECEVFAGTERFLRGVKCVLDEISTVQEIPLKRVLRTPPSGLAAERVYSVYASLRWDNDELIDEYAVSMRKVGGEWSYGDELIRVGKKGGCRCVVYPLEPGAAYEFRVMGSAKGMETKWSEALSVRTDGRAINFDAENAVRGLEMSMGDVGMCITQLNNIIDLSVEDEHKKALGEAGAIDVVLNAMKMHINNVVVCRCGCNALRNITYNADNKVIAGQTGAIGVVLNAMKTHIRDANLCWWGCGSLGNITINADNQVIAGEAGVIDVVLNAMKTHIRDANVCEKGCSSLGNITINADNKTLAVQAGAIDVVLNAMKTHINDPDVCKYGCGALWIISEGSSAIQADICERGGLAILLGVLRKHGDNEDLVETCCGAIGTILSSQRAHSRFCTRDVLDAVKECCEKHKGSVEIRQFFLGLTREEDPRVVDAVPRGVCTKSAFPKCPYVCRYDENYYCSKCCVQQKAFRCRTCDKSKVVLYCEACFRKDHQGHECEEFFYPVRCGTKMK